MFYFFGDFFYRFLSYRFSGNPSDDVEILGYGFFDFFFVDLLPSVFNNKICIAGNIDVADRVAIHHVVKFKIFVQTIGFSFDDDVAIVGFFLLLDFLSFFIEVLEFLFFGNYYVGIGTCGFGALLFANLYRLLPAPAPQYQQAHH